MDKQTGKRRFEAERSHLEAADIPAPAFPVNLEVKLGGTPREIPIFRIFSTPVRIPGFLSRA